MEGRGKSEEGRRKFGNEQCTGCNGCNGWKEEARSAATDSLSENVTDVTKNELPSTNYP
ncbi:hypothetical protein QUA82_14645 [Microcoleus sp. F8-D3]